MEDKELYPVELGESEAEESAEMQDEAQIKNIEPEKSENEEYYSLPGGSRSILHSVLSLLFSILSVGLCYFWYVGAALAVGGAVFALLFKKQFGYFNKAAVAGLMISIFGFVFSAFFLAADLLGII